MERQPELEVRNLRVQYGGLMALDQVSIQVPSNCCVAVLGANGAGKTTLLKTISGILRPSHGEILFRGTQIDALPSHVIARLGVAHLPEGRGIFVDLTVRENLLLAAHYAGIGQKPDLTAIWHGFPMLAEKANDRAVSLSGGQAQMLAIARAMLVRPKILLVDELSFGLAPIVVAQAFAQIQRLNAEHGTAVLLVEQNVKKALELCQFAYVLKNGRIVLSGTPEQLTQDRHQLFAAIGADIGSRTESGINSREMR